MYCVFRFLPYPIGTGTNTASVGCTEGGGCRLVGVDNTSFCCCSSCGSEVGSWGDLLLVDGNKAPVARLFCVIPRMDCLEFTYLILVTY